MAQQRIAFEWILEDSGVDFWRVSAAENNARALGLAGAEQRYANRFLRGLVLLMVVIAAAAGAGLTPNERERREAQKGIAQTLTLENAAWQRRDRGLYESLIDPQIDEDWEEAWRDIWRAGSETKPEFEAKLINVYQDNGYMQATVITQQPAFEWWQTNPYQETRFYRRVDQRWLRTVPPASQWGEARELRTEHLHFTYFERDADAVEAAAPKLEKAFVGMYHTMGLPVPSGTAQVITVVPQPIGRWSTTVPQLHVTSPMLAQIPEGQSDSDYLAYDIMGWFTYRAIRDAAPNLGVRYLYRWPILVWGLRGWLRDDLLEQSSPWHDQAKEVLQVAAAEYLPIRLKDITDLRSNTRPSREEVILRYITAESFVKFVVETYGRERLPVLLDALVRYSDWDEIIALVFGQSIEEFEAAWNLHLAKIYELD